MKIPSRDISVLYRKMQMGLDNALAPLELTSGKVMFFFCLDDKGELTQSQICHELDMDKSTVAKMLMRMEKDGYITKQVNRDDSRAFLVSLTQKAKDVTVAARKTHDTWVNAVTCELTEVERSVFFELLHKVSQKSIHVAEVCYSEKV